MIGLGTLHLIWVDCLGNGMGEGGGGGVLYFCLFLTTTNHNTEIHYSCRQLDIALTLRSASTTVLYNR